MTEHEYRHALDFARPYFFIFQFEPNKPILVFSPDTPGDIRKKLNDIWPVIEAETRRRHDKGLFESFAYFIV